jgi:predicted DNA-binding WGR domain protein
MHRSALHEGQNPKNAKERTMQTERAELYFRQGSSDKVYHLRLENADDKWSVEAQWGRRGSALQSDVKANGVPYEEAKRVYDRILREKTSKGYQIAQATTNGEAPISVGLPASKEQSGHVPELLTPIEEPEAQMLAILPEPTATVVATAAFTGARKGEIRGFTWENYDGSEIRVEKSVWRSHVDEPKRPKSKGAIPVIAQLKGLLDQHWERCGSTDSEFSTR